jgi:hypothetical protein
VDFSAHCFSVDIFSVLLCLFLQHGRVKTKTNAENKEANRNEKEKKSKLYKIGIEKTFKKVLFNGNNYQL